MTNQLPKAPQEGGLDGRVRVPESALPELRIRHLTSAIDLSIAVTESLARAPKDVVTGFTEWVGDWRGVQLSIGWDWGFIHGDAMLINRDELRTNIELVSVDGQARSPLFCRLRLAQWLESLHWQDTVLRSVALRVGGDA